MFQRPLYTILRQSRSYRSSIKASAVFCKQTDGNLPTTAHLQFTGKFRTENVRNVTSMTNATHIGFNTVTLNQDKGKIQVDWNDGKTSNFHSMWLRFNCKCDKCWDPQSKMPRVRMEEIPFNMTIKEVTKTDNGKIRVTWEQEDHVGEFDPVFLRNHCYSKESMQKRRQDAKPNFSSQTITEIPYSEVHDSDEGKYRWLKTINEEGVCLLKGVPTEDEYLRKIIGIIGPIQSTYYGELYNVQLHDIPINLAYSNEGLTFHMDLQQYESPPGIQFLHCIEFDDHIKGGETLFLDMYKVAEEFRSQYPEHFRTLCNVSASFERIHNARDHPVKMIMKKPHFILNHEDEIIAMNWHFPPAGTVLVDEEDVEKYYQAFHLFGKSIQTSPYVRPVRLRPGDCISFNNRRTAHARNPFQTSGKGSRFLQGGYANIDDYKSRLMTMAEAVGSTDPIKRCFNNDWL